MTTIFLQVLEQQKTVR